MSFPGELISFFKLVTEEMKDDDMSSDGLHMLLEPILSILQKDMQKGTILYLPTVSLNMLEAFSKIPELALVSEVIIRH